MEGGGLSIMKIGTAPLIRRNCHPFGGGAAGPLRLEGTVRIVGWSRGRGQALTGTGFPGEKTGWKFWSPFLTGVGNPDRENGVEIPGVGNFGVPFLTELGKPGSPGLSMCVYRPLSDLTLTETPGKVPPSPVPPPSGGP